MRKIIQCSFPVIITICFATCLAGAHAAPVSGVKTSQHESFKPRDFERLAVIVKPLQSQGHFGGGMSMSRGRQQSQTDRLIEQGFMRVLMAHGYTLVSRTDLDSAMQEKGLDDAHMTDEKLTEEAGKLLHVSALMIVSVDDFNVTQSRQVQRQPGQQPTFYGTSTQTVYQCAASVSARLVKISDNMVMWTGDMNLDRTLASQAQGTQLLGSMAEAIASSFPSLGAKNE